jgi:subtilisin family serine protease
MVRIYFKVIFMFSGKKHGFTIRITALLLFMFLISSCLPPPGNVFDPICGNGRVEQGEECDDGSLNGVPCTPGIGETCNYCSDVCKIVTIEGPPPPEPVKDYLEACKYPVSGNTIDSVNQALAQGHMMLASPVPGVNPVYDGFLIEVSENLYVNAYPNEDNINNRGTEILRNKLDTLNIPEKARNRVKKAAEKMNKGRFVVQIEEEYIERILEHPNVKRVYPNFIFRVKLCDSLERIGAPSFLKEHSSYGEGVTIAVLDTGVDYNHPLLGGCIGAECKVIGGYDFVDNDNDPMDKHGHGTHVASIAAGNEPLGGVAPEAKIMAIRVLNENGEGTLESIINGLDYVLEQHRLSPIDIVVMSLGAALPTENPLNEKVEELSAEGILIVVAAGNNGPFPETITSPANARSSLSVGATNNWGQIMSFSSRGPVLSTNGSMFAKPDVVSPGADICAAMSEQFRMGGVNCGERYVSVSGTSMAAPHVAGLAALIKADNPVLDAEQIKRHIKNTAVRDQYGKYNALELIGHGSIRADIALNTEILPEISLKIGKLDNQFIRLTGIGPQDTEIEFKEIGSGKVGTTLHVSGEYTHDLLTWNIDDGMYSVIASGIVMVDDREITIMDTAYVSISNFELSMLSDSLYIGTKSAPSFKVNTSVPNEELVIQIREVHKRWMEESAGPWSVYCTISQGQSSCKGTILEQGQYDARVSALTENGRVHSKPLAFNIVEGLVEGTAMHIPHSFGRVLLKAVTMGPKTLHSVHIKIDPKCTGWCSSNNMFLETSANKTRFKENIGTVSSRRIGGLIDGVGNRALAHQNTIPPEVNIFEFTLEEVFAPIAYDIDYRHLTRLGDTYYATNGVYTMFDYRDIRFIKNNVQKSVRIPFLKEAYTGVDTDDLFILSPVNTLNGVCLVITRSAYLNNDPSRALLVNDIYNEEGIRMNRFEIVDTRNEPSFIAYTRPMVSDINEAVYYATTTDWKNYELVKISCDGSIERKGIPNYPYGLAMDNGIPIGIRNTHYNSNEFIIESDEVNISYVIPANLAFDRVPALYDLTGDGHNDFILYLRSRFAHGDASRLVGLNRNGSVLFEREIGVLRGGLQLDLLLFTDHNNDGKMEILLGLDDVLYTYYPGVGGSVTFTDSPAALRMVIETEYPYDKNRIGWQIPFGDSQGRYAGGP